MSVYHLHVWNKYTRISKPVFENCIRASREFSHRLSLIVTAMGERWCLYRLIGGKSGADLLFVNRRNEGMSRADATMSTRVKL